MRSPRGGDTLACLFVMLTILMMSAAAGLPGSLAAAEPRSGPQAGPVTVRDAWIREAPATQAATAAYATLVNGSSDTVTLVGVSVEGAGLVELHEMVLKGDVMSMVKVPSVPVPARGQVDLAPGGRHVMLFQLTRDFVAGGVATVTFRFADGSSTVAQARIRKKSAMGT